MTVVAIFLAGHSVGPRHWELLFPALSGDCGQSAHRRPADVRLRRDGAHAAPQCPPRGVDAGYLSCRRSPDRFALHDLGGRSPPKYRRRKEKHFLLAAAKPGEESKEPAELKHGAFTYALLEGLDGAADVDGDGVVSVSDLFAYVARSVPRLTNGRQHPYSKMEGTDLTFAAVKRVAEEQEAAHWKPARNAPEVAATPMPTPSASWSSLTCARIPRTTGWARRCGSRSTPS